MIHASFDWWRSPDADEDAYFLYNCGQEDALALEKPTSDDYYYLVGWHDTKRKLASGELCEEFARIQAEIEQQKI
jgi:hypothetical protein